VSPVDTIEYPPVARWRMPASALDDMYKELAEDGRQGREGIVLWVGRRQQDGIADVTHLLLLRGPNVSRGPDQIRIAPAVMNLVTDVVGAVNGVLVGQIHSHAPWCGTDLSYTDRRYGIAVPDYLSAVAPDFGLRIVPVTEWGVHVYREHRWVRLSREEVATAIELVSGRGPPVVAVGEEGA
jgi:proteasome lid subunit RPN8/RPN11